MSKLYFGGMPTETDVRKLGEEFPAIRVGDEISYEQVEAVLRLNRKHNRFQTVTDAWRRKLLGDGIELAVVRTVGYRALSPSERIDAGVKGVQSGLRKQIRSINKTDRVVTDDPFQKKRQEVMHRYGIALRAEATSTLKQLEPPKEQERLPRPNIKAVA